MLDTGWLAPDGVFYRCNQYDHVDEADRICDMLNWHDNRKYSDEILMSNGFVHISVSRICFQQWEISWEHFLTDNQKAFLKPYFEDENTLPVSFVAKEKWEFEN